MKIPLKKHPVTNGSTSLWGHDRHGLVLAAQDSHIRDGYTGHRDRKSCQKFGLLASKISKIWNDWEGVDFFRNIIMSIPQADSETVQWPQKDQLGFGKRSWHDAGLLQQVTACDNAMFILSENGSILPSPKAERPWKAVYSIGPVSPVLVSERNHFQWLKISDLKSESVNRNTKHRQIPN